MRLNNDKFFRNFNDKYLIFLDMFYKTKPIIYIKNDIKNQIRILQKRNKLNQIKERNINYWLIRGWSYNEGTKKIKEINYKRKKPKFNSILTIGYWILHGFNEIEAKEKISKIQKDRYKKAFITKQSNPNYIPPLSPFTYEHWIKKGIINKKEIKYKINSQRKLNKEYWLERGFSDAEAIIAVSKYQRENGEKRLIKWKNKKHTYKYKKQYNTKVEYFLEKGYSLEESKRLLKERQTTFTLDICIDKYGEIKGKEIFTNRQEKWQKSLSENGNLKFGYSKISQELFYSILNKYDIDDRENVYFATKNNEIRLPKKSGGVWIYDFADIKTKKIIEYNGDQYHANPKIFESVDNPHPYDKETLAQEIWDKDKKKLNIAKNKGFDVLVIWDSDYKKNKEKTIEKCLIFLDI